jgi:hypothetical protein
LLQVVALVACATGIAPVPTDAGADGGGGSETVSASTGMDLGPCGMDCSKFVTPPCTISVCNTGQELGPVNTCVVVVAPKGTACDDGKYCTTNDVCDNGTCAGAVPFTCGLTPDPCSSVICYEESKSCDTAPVNDGTPCTTKDLCQVNGVCQIGECKGQPKDCTFSPLNECNTVACEPATGKCVATPDPEKDDAPCIFTGDLCKINKTCTAGQCGGVTPKDCSALNAGCEVGVCDAANGFCVPQPAPLGTVCTEGVAECQAGACDDKGKCQSSVGPAGVACNDHDACTKSDTCGGAGSCGGQSVAGCLLYLKEGFEVCPSGWTFGGDWQCGKPINVGPATAHTGSGAIATKIAGNYSINQSYTTTVADSPAINLTAAINPVVSFWAWYRTEGGTFDGWNLNISVNGGQTFTEVTTVTPPYALTVAAKPAWGGDHSAEGWNNYSADLTAYIGKSVILRFAFRSDGATVYPGVYIDDVVVAEPLQTPLFITTASPLADTYAENGYAMPIVKTGGTSGSAWSINPGAVNAAWLTIDPTTGVLKGKPTAADVGPVKLSVHVEEPSLPSNFADKTFTFTVKPDAYYSGFEGACPNGWTLTGDWQCGVPMNVGPAIAFAGTQCLGTQIATTYSNSQTWAATTATSPDISLGGIANPILTFRMWVDTEGATYDGANLQISTDGGINYTIIANAIPAYPLPMVAGLPAWGGHQSALGWQAVQADLTAYSGQLIRLRFAFNSDTSGAFPGVYIDDVVVN